MSAERGKACRKIGGLSAIFEDNLLCGCVFSHVKTYCGVGSPGNSVCLWFEFVFTHELFGAGDVLLMRSVAIVLSSKLWSHIVEVVPEA